MKHALALSFVVTLTASPMVAQEAEPTTPPADEDGFSLMEEGAKLVLRGLMSEMEPALDQMEQALTEVGPALEDLGAEIGPKLRQLVAMVDDFKNYDAPVMLPNGDILIRRNAPLVPRTEPAPRQDAEPVPGPNGEIEL